MYARVTTEPKTKPGDQERFTLLLSPQAPIEEAYPGGIRELAVSGYRQHYLSRERVRDTLHQKDLSASAVMTAAVREELAL